MTDSEKLLRELIALPTVNPAFLPAGDPRTGESRAVDFLAAVAGRGGLDIDFQEVFPGRFNLLARLSPEAPKHRLILAPHLDTVGEPGLDRGAFDPQIRHGRIYGRGACDTKGSVAAMLCAVLRLAQSPQRPRQTEILFAGLIDEENSQTGSRVLARSGIKADLAIVGEPTLLQVVTAHKGDLWLRLETRGRSAHGARPELGRNAVHLMAKVVVQLETSYASELRSRKHPLLGRPTINVGSIAGGTQPNIVPDQCVISIDRRTLPGENERTVRKELQALFSRKGLEAHIFNQKSAPCPPLETNPNLPWVRKLMEFAGQKKPQGVHFFCDAALLAQGRIPSVVFGPGDIAQAHTAEEWISLKSLARATDLLSAFLQSLP